MDNKCLKSSALDQQLPFIFSETDLGEKASRYLYNVGVDFYFLPFLMLLQEGQTEKWCQAKYTWASLLRSACGKV